MSYSLSSKGHAVLSELEILKRHTQKISKNALLMLRSQHVPTARTLPKGSLGPDRQAVEGAGLVLWQDEIKNTGSTPEKS